MLINIKYEYIIYNILFLVLLAPTRTIDPTLPVEERPEPATKTTAVQTMYRESEAQTIPYTPAHIVPNGTAPEVLLLKGLTYTSGGLSVGNKELDMIDFARMKRDVESNLPPFTDEASMLMRQRLMEAQEMREFKMREGEIDARREARILVIEQALREKDESSEFLASQRVESIRQARMEEREVNLQKIRNKRIKVLRKLANRRNQQDPQLSSTEPRDIIDDYFDKASEVYVPIRRKGEVNKSDLSKYDINSRTAPLSTVAVINALEATIPKRIKSSTIELGVATDPMEHPKSLSQTGYLLPKKGGRAAEPRMTSAAVRDERHKKKYIEEMARILAKQKVSSRATTTPAATSAPASPSRLGSAEGAMADGASSPSRAGTGASSPVQRKGVKVRPVSPDFTKVDRSERPENLSLTIACVILQKLLRGRAVQNTMYEGRFRRSDLILELRAVDEVNRLREKELSAPLTVVEPVDQAPAKNEIVVPLSAEEKAEREQRIKDAAIDSVAGSVSSNLLFSLMQEKQRNEMIAEMQQQAVSANEVKRMREAMEAGRRQREYMQLPIALSPEETEEELKKVSISKDPHRLEDPVEESMYAKEALDAIVSAIVLEAVTNVSRPGTSQNGEAAANIISSESATSLLSGVSGVSGTEDYVTGSSMDYSESENDGQFPAGMVMSATLMQALGMDTTGIVTESDWKPPAESGIDAAQKEGYSLAS